jgi:hypothetical protein
MHVVEVARVSLTEDQDCETPLCLMWCIWRERNTMNFKDCEISTIELKTVMFRSLYAWMVAYNSPPLVLQNFGLVCFFFFFFLFPSLIGGLSCILRMYSGCAFQHFLMRLIYLEKKVIIQYV